MSDEGGYCRLETCDLIELHVAGTCERGETVHSPTAGQARWCLSCRSHYYSNDPFAPCTRCGRNRLLAPRYHCSRCGQHVPGGFQRTCPLCFRERTFGEVPRVAVRRAKPVLARRLDSGLVVCPACDGRGWMTRRLDACVVCCGHGGISMIVYQRYQETMKGR